MQPGGGKAMLLVCSATRAVFSDSAQATSAKSRTHRCNGVIKTMRIATFGFVIISISSLIGCAVEAPDGASDEASVEQAATTASSNPLPMTSGSFQGKYNVPAPSSLSDASTFTMAEVDWTIVSGVVTLHYDLPVGLVGGDVSVSLTAPLTSGTASDTLSGTAGSGTCTCSGSVVSCSESLGGIGQMPVSTAVVQSTASANKVPVSDAVAVANRFGNDPIGTVSFDMSKPSTESGGGHGGGGGGKGPGHGGHGSDD
jgi:hypothetical protein